MHKIVFITTYKFSISIIKHLFFVFLDSIKIQTIYNLKKKKIRAILLFRLKYSFKFKTLNFSTKRKKNQFQLERIVIFDEKSMFPKYNVSAKEILTSRVDPCSIRPSIRVCFEVNRGAD